MQTRTPTIRLLTTLAITVLAAQLAQAQSIWNGGTGLNWSTAANWLPAVVPGATDDVVFTNNATATEGTVNNIVDTDLSVQSLSYQASNSEYHTTQINFDSTLTITGNVATALFVGTGANENVPVRAAIEGSGTLSITNTSGVLNVRQGSNSGSYTGHAATLDMSGLSNLTAYVSQVLVAGDGLTGSSHYAQTREGGVLYLAQTNVIVCAAGSSTPGLLIGDSPGLSGKGTVYLGQTNAIFSDGGIVVGARRNSNSGLYFNPNVTNGSAFFRDSTGTGRQSLWAVAYNTGSGTSASKSEADFSPGTVDALVDTLYVGYGDSSSSITTGTLTFGNGTIDVNTVEVGYVASSGSVTYGTLNVGSGGRLIVNNYLRLAYNQGTVPTGTLSVNGGSVWIKGDLIDGGGFGQSVTVMDGSLKVGGNVGSATIPLMSMALSGASLTFDLGLSANPASPLWQISALTVTAPVTNNVLGSSLALGQFTLIKYASLGGDDGSGFVLGSLPARVQGYLSNNTANSSIDLVITNVTSPKWAGTVDRDWDIDQTANWIPISGGAPMTYFQTNVPGDSVLFDDSATGTNVVNLTTNLSPSGSTVNNSSKHYTFVGSGGLSGPTGLTKKGSGLLTIENTGTNDFTGEVVINAGTVQIAGSADRLPINATVTLANDPGATLDLNNTNQTLGSISGGDGAGGNVTLGTGTLTIAGDGGVYGGTISGDGAVIKSGSGTQVLSGANVYGGGTLVSGGTLVVANTTGSATGTGSIVVDTNATFQIGNADASGSFTATTITNNGLVVLDRNDYLFFSTLVTGDGGLVQSGGSTVVISTPNTYTGQTTIAVGALQITDPAALGTGPIRINNDPTANLRLSGGITLSQPMTISMKGAAANTAPAVVNMDSTNTLAAPITGAGGGTYWTFQIDSGKLVVTAPFTPTGIGGQNVVRVTGSGDCDWPGDITNSGTTWLTMNGLGTWTLWGNDSYAGKTTVNSGLAGYGALIVNGALTASTNISVVAGTLGGTGVISGPVYVDDTLAPGAPSVGTLTINNSLILNGTALTLIEVSDSGYDQVAGLTSVTLGGTLQVTLNRTLVGGEAFKLFDAASYSGDFSTYTLPALSPPFSWDTNSVPVDGTLRVAGSIAPHVTSTTIGPDHNIQLGGTGPDGWTYQILTTTNVAAPLSEWVSVATNVFTGGTFNWTDSQSANYPRRFYQVLTQSP